MAAVLSTIDVKSCSFINNSAQSAGGGLVTYNESTITLSGSTLEGDHIAMMFLMTV